MSTIGQRIRQKRNELGLTQKDVGIAVGRSTGAVTQWEADMTKPNGQNLIKLARYLNCSADWLLTGKDDPHHQLDLGGIRFEASRKGQLIYVFEMGEVSDFGSLAGLMEHKREVLLTTAPVGNGTAFGLRVMDDDEISLPYLKIPRGSVLVVDSDHPEIQSIVGKLVLVHHKDAPSSSIKKLMFDGKNYHLIPTNPAFSPSEFDENTEIVGVIKQIVIEL